MAGCAEHAHHDQAVEPLQNGPGDVTVEFETDEEAVLGEFLAIHDLAMHGRFSLHRSDLYFLPKLPGSGGIHSGAVRTDVVGKCSFEFLGAQGPHRREIYDNYDPEPSFFSAGLVPNHALLGLCASVSPGHESVRCRTD